MKDIIDTFMYIDKLYQINQDEDKIKYIADIQLKLKEKNIINNNKINNLIRDNKITIQMSTSLLNDIYYKNKILKDLLKAVKVIFNNESDKDDLEFHNNLEKSLYKLRNRKTYLKKLLLKENIDITKKKSIEDEIKSIDYALESNKK
ncbi:MAG: hypothetical protein Q8S84_05210 [bacterium]|nr:hypothetical protein [bacterium]